MKNERPGHDEADTGRNQFGTFGGVFTPCILTILGVILFMRSNFVLGQAGILNTMLILLLAKSITFFTALSTSAIGTNIEVKGGGAYYLISRVLGPEFGGAIGILLFLAQAISVPFYVLGFTEALAQSFPVLQPYYAAIAFGTAGVLFAVTYTGASWAIKLQYVIMGVLVAAIVAFMGGGLLNFSPARFVENLSGGYTAVDVEAPLGPKYSFWMVFAIYFPAVTGIMSGINMSGDLKEPARSLPRGTLMAIAVGGAVYLGQLLIFGGAFRREDLIARPYLILTENALFGLGMLVAAGMFAATLSSALGSYMGAPRVLQAVARDKILRALRPFARGAAKTDEPRRALMVTGALTVAVLTWASLSGGRTALNVVAALITEFFLYTYGMLNIAAFIEGAGQNPSFRPRFRFFHWSTALAGGLGCVGVAFIINPTQALVAFLVLSALVWYIRRRDLGAALGDTRRGFVYKTARDSLVRLANMEETSRNWRPTALVFSGNPESRETLVSYAVWCEAGRGVVFMASILVGTLEEYGPRRRTAITQLSEFCKKRGIPAFPVVVIDENLEHGIASVLQATSVGPIRPNLLVLGWSEKVSRVESSVAHMRLAQQLGMGLVVLNPGERPFHYGRKRIDVWWRGRKNGALMLLLAHLITRNWEWSHTEVRLLRLIEDEEGRNGASRGLQELIDDARVDAQAHVVVSSEPFPDVLRRESAGADCVFLGFELPEEGQETSWYQERDAFIHELPTTIFVNSASQDDLLE